jgi:hypothetical protein
MSMKIIPQDYTRLEELINVTIKEVLPKIKVPAGHELNETQHIWNVWHITVERARIYPGGTEDYLFLRSLHDYLNDSHIETALRKIILKAERVAK